MVWNGFKGYGQEMAIVANCPTHPHDPDEIDRMDPRPMVVSHTACTDKVLLDLFGDSVARRIPKPAPLDTLLHGVMEALAELDPGT